VEVYWESGLKRHSRAAQFRAFRRRAGTYLDICGSNATRPAFTVTEAPTETVKISKFCGFAGETKPKGVLSRDEYRESKKGACDHTVPAIVADGEQIGKMKWVCVSREQECPIHGASYRSIGENSEGKAERLKREAEARLELKRRRAIFDAIREKARQDRRPESRP
jgi:hypothetical protein